MEPITPNLPPRAFTSPNFAATADSASLHETGSSFPPLRISGDAARFNHREGNDDYAQPRALHDRVMKADERARLYLNIAESMQGVPSDIIDRALGHFDKIAKAYGDGIRSALASLTESKRAAD